MATGATGKSHVGNLVVIEITGLSLNRPKYEILVGLQQNFYEMYFSGVNGASALTKIEIECPLMEIGAHGADLGCALALVVVE